MLFIGGTHDVAILTGGTETVQAFQGYNSITTGAGNDTISIGGTGNRVNTGSGKDTINDSGTGNTIVLPQAGTGMVNVYGYAFQNGDTFDLKSALAATAWNGSIPTIGQFLHISKSGNDAVVSISATAAMTGTKIADFHDSGAVSLTTLLARSVL